MNDPEANEQAPHAREPDSAGGARRTKVLIAVGIAVVVLVAAGAVWATRGDGGSGNADDAAAGTGAKTSSSALGNSSSTSSTSATRGGTGPTTSDNGKSGTQTTAGNPVGGTNTTVRGSSATTLPHTPGSTGPPATVPPTITAAYTEGFEAECRHIWQTADADGLLWDADWIDSGGVPVTVCYKTIDKRYAGLYETVDSARQGGTADADESMVDWAFNGVLTNTSQTRIWNGT